MIYAYVVAETIREIDFLTISDSTLYARFLALTQVCKEIRAESFPLFKDVRREIKSQIERNRLRDWLISLVLEVKEY